MSDTGSSQPNPMISPAGMTTDIGDIRGRRLGQLVGKNLGPALRRIVPQDETPKPPVAAFDSAL
jgi:FXSXX-COOH protein